MGREHDRLWQRVPLAAGHFSRPWVTGVRRSGLRKTIFSVIRQRVRIARLLRTARSSITGSHPVRTSPSKNHLRSGVTIAIPCVSSPRTHPRDGVLLEPEINRTELSARSSPPKSLSVFNGGGAHIRNGIGVRGDHTILVHDRKHWRCRCARCRLMCSFLSTRNLTQRMSFSAEWSVFVL